MVERDRLERQEDALSERGSEIHRQVDEWVEIALPAYAAAEEAKRDPERAAAAQKRIAEIKRRAEPVAILLGGSVARIRGAEIIYELGLCKQEEAERLQARHDLRVAAGQKPSPQEESALRDAWRAAAFWWRTFVEEKSNFPAAPAARWHHARALAQLGDRQAAVAALEDLSGPLTPLEKVARLQLSKQLKGAK
jgi:hypothetical protein